MAHTTEGPKDSGVSGGAPLVNGSVTDQPSPPLSSPSLPNHRPVTQHYVSSNNPASDSSPLCDSNPQQSGPHYQQQDQDSHSLASQDSSIPTLEINHPKPFLHCQPRLTDRCFIQATNHYPGPATLNLDQPVDNPICKSSTVLCTSYDSTRFFGSAGRVAAPGTLYRSDDVSMDSMSSLSTELSASNDDILDYTVDPGSSSIVTLETDTSGAGSAHFSDVTLTSSLSPGNLSEMCSPIWRQAMGSEVVPQLENEGRTKRLGPLTSFFSRNLFTKKVKDSVPTEQKDPSWKLFGKVPPCKSPSRDPKKIQKEYETNSGRAGPGHTISPRRSVKKNLDFETLFTTALILEDRPANLPAKPVEEAQKHKQQYEEMVALAKKREVKDAQKRRKQLEDRCKLEESIGNAAQTWSQEILPNWSSTCGSRRVRELLWQGVPPSVRGKVWGLAMGNELNITPELFNICLSRAREKWKAMPAPASDTNTKDAGSSDREASLELIKLDISRTFPHLCIFQQQGGPYYDILHSILGAYTCYRPDVGYVQGMSFIAAVLILNLDTADAFIAFANLLNKPCQMAFFRVDHSLMLTYFGAFEVFFEENLPKLFAHFKNNNLTPDIYLIDWIFTLYSRSLPLDLACRVWDVFCRDGEEFLFRTALGILRQYEDVLTRMDFIHMAQFLTRLPELLPAESLFAHIAAVHMTSRNRKWAQVLQARQKEQERTSPVPKR